MLLLRPATVQGRSEPQPQWEPNYTSLRYRLLSDTTSKTTYPKELQNVPPLMTLFHGRCTHNPCNLSRNPCPCISNLATEYSKTTRQRNGPTNCLPIEIMLQHWVHSSSHTNSPCGARVFYPLSVLSINQSHAATAISQPGLDYIKTT